MLSGIISSILLVLFLVGTALVYSPYCRKSFDAAARIPLDDDGENAP